MMKGGLGGLMKQAQQMMKMREKVLADLAKKMREAAANLEFEDAARFRDELRRLEALDLLGALRARLRGAGVLAFARRSRRGLADLRLLLGLVRHRRVGK